MNHFTRVLNLISDLQGWNDEVKIIHLLAYLEECRSQAKVPNHADFQKYLVLIADEENEASDLDS